MEEMNLDEQLRRFELLSQEANEVRARDQGIVESLLTEFYDSRLSVGFGFQRAHGAILSGDYFNLVRLPDNNFLFFIADVSGHGLPAYTTMVRLRSAITVSLKELHFIYHQTGVLNYDYMIQDIADKFTDIMEVSNSDDFALVNFVFFTHDSNRIRLQFYNRGMLFPLLLNRSKGFAMDLNYPSDDWMPEKGHMLSTHMRALTGDEYYFTPSTTLCLEEGDGLFFYTDGITEAYNPQLNEEFGVDRVSQLLLSENTLSPQELLNTLFRNIFTFLGEPWNQKDDMTGVLLDFNGRAGKE